MFSFFRPKAVSSSSMSDPMDLLADLLRGNVKEKTGDIPHEFLAAPNKVKARCPYDCTTISPRAIGDELIGLNTDQGLLTCAGAGSGKTVNLIGHLVHYQGSVAALDPKNDLAEATARWRQDELAHHNIQTSLRYAHLAPSHRVIFKSWG